MEGDVPAGKMSLWSKYDKPSPDYVKDVAYGSRKYKAINPEYDAMRATTEWGPYGQRWGLQDCTYERFNYGDTVVLVLHARFTYPGDDQNLCSFPISVDLKFTPGDDCYKKLRTMAQSKALSLLGFNATIFMGCWDDPKYVNEMEMLHGKESEHFNDIASTIRSARTVERVSACLARAKQIHASGHLSTERFEEIDRLCETQVGQIKQAQARGTVQTMQAIMRDMIGVDMESETELNAICQWMVEADYAFVVSKPELATRFVEQYNTLSSGGMDGASMLQNAKEENE